MLRCALHDCRIGERRGAAQLALLATTIPHLNRAENAHPKINRRGGDSNPRYRINRTPVFETGPFSRSGTSPEGGGTNTRRKTLHNRCHDKPQLPPVRRMDSRANTATLWPKGPRKDSRSGASRRSMRSLGTEKGLAVQRDSRSSVPGPTCPGPACFLPAPPVTADQHSSHRRRQERHTASAKVVAFSAPLPTQEGPGEVQRIRQTACDPSLVRGEAGMSAFLGATLSVLEAALSVNRAADLEGKLFEMHSQVHTGNGHLGPQAE